MKFIKKAILKYRLRRLVNLHLKIDESMKKRGWPGWRRRQWWRDFIRSPEAREEFCIGLLKDLEAIK